MEILQKAIDNVKTISKEAKRRTESKLKDVRISYYSALLKPNANIIILALFFIVSTN